MSASQVLNAPTYYTVLAPNDALQDLNICNQCKSWKLIALKVLLKTFTQLKDVRKAVLPQTRLVRHAPKAQDTWSVVLPEMVTFKAEVSGYWFFNSWSISEKKFCISISNPYPKISEIWYLISIRIQIRHWLNMQQTGSGFRPANGPSFLKTYSSVACNMTLIHYKCAVDCTMLGENVVNLTL